MATVPDPRPAPVATGAHPGVPRTAGLLRVATAGSVDDGKSTLIGRLLFDSKQVFQDQLEHVEETSKRMGDDYVNLALLTDGLRAEREQGITIDVAYRYFATPRRRFILADTPGHVRYTRNMVTGASTADVSIVLIDARNGVLEQSKRHVFVSSLVGVRHVVVCVNKMDLVDHDAEVFERIVEDFDDFAAKLDLPDVTFIPISALNGDNVVDRSENMPWYEGSPLLYHLEHVHTASDRNLVDARFPVQWVIRPMSHEYHDYRAYAGQIASGIWRVGDEVAVLPSGERSRIYAIDGPNGPVEEAVPPMSVAIRLEDDIDVSRGDMICRPNNRPRLQRDVEAMVCWMSEEPVRAGTRYLLKHSTRWSTAFVEDLRYRVDVESLHRDEDAGSLALNDIGRLHLRTSVPLALDDYRRNRSTGSFILIDETTHDTVGAGMVVETLTGPDAEQAQIGHSPNVVWQEEALSREDRWKALGQRGATVWLTGLPASGKSTIAAELERWLLARGRTAYRLDGDNLRHGLNANLGFSHEDRVENVRRTANVARLFADSGAISIVSLVSPYAADREIARHLHDEEGLDFLEVHVATPLDECERRDPKGLYARARAGEITGMTGVDDPYEPPESPEVAIGGQTPAEATTAIVAALRRAGVLPAE